MFSLLTCFCRRLFWWGERERELLFCRHRGVILSRGLHGEAVGKSLVMECGFTGLESGTSGTGGFRGGGERGAYLPTTRGAGTRRWQMQ